MFGTLATSYLTARLPFCPRPSFAPCGVSSPSRTSIDAFQVGKFSTFSFLGNERSCVISWHWSFINRVSYYPYFSHQIQDSSDTVESSDISRSAGHDRRVHEAKTTRYMPSFGYTGTAWYDYVIFWHHSRHKTTTTYRREP